MKLVISWTALFCDHKLQSSRQNYLLLKNKKCDCLQSEGWVFGKAFFFNKNKLRRGNSLLLFQRMWWWSFLSNAGDCWSHVGSMDGLLSAAECREKWPSTRIVPLSCWTNYAPPCLQVYFVFSDVIKFLFQLYSIQLFETEYFPIQIMILQQCHLCSLFLSNCSFIDKMIQ